MKTLFAACLCSSLLYLAVVNSAPDQQPAWPKGTTDVRIEALSGAHLPFNSLVFVDAVVRRCVDQQVYAYVAESSLTPTRLCNAEKAFLHCFDETESSGRAERGLAVLRSLVLGQYIATVLPFCGTVNHGDKLRDVNKNAAGECTILDVQHCFAKAVFSQSEPWTPCLVQPLAFECYLHECLGPKVGPVPNIIGNVMAYHLNSTFTAPGMCAHMETTQISNEYDYLY
ncbi:uncharacterized protein [Branchiostoma lanceolatum]|uniref:Hypp473 protein n=1 Tax=Branchiostoma lanceolatum TaxID=7740 RepID=A0A8J9YJJ8_BRALA|nr:Hypp473 [Branchiostoma lanceolatum]